jgi:hypothetical protein
MGAAIGVAVGGCGMFVLLTIWSAVA